MKKRKWRKRNRAGQKILIIFLWIAFGEVAHPVLCHEVKEKVSSFCPEGKRSRWLTDDPYLFPSLPYSNAQNSFWHQEPLFMGISLVLTKRNSQEKKQAGLVKTLSSGPLFRLKRLGGENFWAQLRPSLVWTRRNFGAKDFPEKCHFS